MAKDNKSEKTHIQSVGRRKNASARVRLHEGNENHTVNGKPIEQYFSAPLMKSIYEAPLEAVEAKNLYMTVKVVGGGILGQARAVAHGLARSLVAYNGEWKSVLRQEGLVTRDPRMKERRKAGLAQSARAKKSSPKR